MNATDAPPQSATRFWSIERFVAFVAGPVVIAGAGWLSSFLATELGMSVSSETLAGVFGVGSLSAAGLAYKWLHGRQLETSAQKLLTTGAIGSLAGSPVGNEFLHTTLKDLEGLAQHAAQHTATAIIAATGKPAGAAAFPPAPSGSDLPPPADPIPPADHDPAPAGQAADAGAAPTA